MENENYKIMSFNKEQDNKINLNLINELMNNIDYIKNNEIKKMLIYYKILKVENNGENFIRQKLHAKDLDCNQEHIKELTDMIFNSFIYLISSNDFNIKKYLSIRMKNELIMEEIDIDFEMIEEIIAYYIDDNQSILFKLLNLHIKEFKYNSETGEYNYLPEEKNAFNYLKNILNTLIFNIFDTYLINYYYY
jgi:hypothetical protein